MKHMGVAFLLSLAAIAAGCGGGGPSPTPTTAPAPLVTLTASPSTYTFALNETMPISVWVSRNTGTLTGFTANNSNPQAFGVSVGISGAVAQVVVLPISSNGQATTLTFVDASGATTTTTLNPALCGRPDNLDFRSQLIWPLPSATGIATNIGTLYFAVFSRVAPSGTKLHIVAGTDATIEGGTLQTAVPPPGAAAPTPPPGLIATTMSASTPSLPSGANIHTQIYDDTCQGAILPGTFST